MAEESDSTLSDSEEDLYLGSQLIGARKSRGGSSRRRKKSTGKKTSSKRSASKKTKKTSSTGKQKRKTAKQSAKGKSKKGDEKSKSKKGDEKSKSKKGDEKNKKKKGDEKDKKKKGDEKDKKKKGDEKDKKKEEDEDKPDGGEGEEAPQKEKKSKGDSNFNLEFGGSGGGDSSGGGGGESGGGSGDFGGGGEGTTVVIQQNERFLVGTGGNAYNPVTTAGFPPAVAQGLADRRVFSNRAEMGLELLREEAARRQALNANANREEELRDAEQKYTLEDMRAFAKEQNANRASALEQARKAEEVPFDSFEKIQEETQLRLAKSDNPVILEGPTFEDDLRTIVREEVELREIDKEAAERNARSVVAAAGLLGVPTRTLPSGEVVLENGTGPELFAITDSKEKRNQQIDDLRALKKNNPGILKEAFGTSLVAEDISCQVGSLARGAQLEELPVPTKIAGQDRAIREILQFFASAYDQLGAFLDVLKIDSMSWKEVFILILRDFVGFPGARTLTEVVPLQLQANLYFECGYAKSFALTFYQMIKLLALELITIAICKRAGTLDISIMYASRKIELAEKYAGAISVLLGMSDSEERAWLSIAGSMIEGRSPDSKLFVEAFPKSHDGAIHAESSKYSYASRTMVDVMRAIQDIVEGIAQSPVGFESPYYQFLSCQSWLVPTTYVGRMGLHNGVNFAKLLKSWMLFARSYFTDPKNTAGFHKSSEAMTMWLNEFYPEAAPIWKSYTEEVFKKKGLRTSYLDNLPAVGWIIDARHAPPQSRIRLEQVVMASRIDRAANASTFVQRLGFAISEHTTIEVEGHKPSVDAGMDEGDLIDQFLYHKASGNDDKANVIQGKIYALSADMDALKRSLRPRNQENIQCFLSDYHEKASSRVRDVVARFNFKQKAEFSLSSLPVEVAVLLRAVLGKAWAVDGETKSFLSSDEEAFLWKLYCKKAENPWSDRLTTKLDSVYGKDDELAKKVVLSNGDFVDSASFLAGWAHGNPIADQNLSNASTIKELFERLLVVPNDRHEFWNSLKASAAEARTKELVSKEREAELTNSASVNAKVVERTIYSILLIPFFVSNGEIYDEEGTLFYSGSATLNAYSQEISIYYSSLLDTVKTLYGPSSARYRFADHLRMARYYQDRSNFMASALRATDAQRYEHNRAIVEEIARSAEDAKDSRLYRKLIFCVLEEHPRPTSRFFKQPKSLTREHADILRFVSLNPHI